MTGIIVKGIGGFYYVKSPDGNICECRAKGLFRKEKIKPMIGDYVTVENGIMIKEEILGKALTVDKSFNEFDIDEIPESKASESEEPENEEQKSESDMFHDLLMRKFF